MADQNVTTLGIAVDSSGVRTAEGDLKNFAKAGNEAAKSASVLERAIESSAKPANQAATAIGKIAPASSVLKNAASGAEKFAASAKLTAYQTQQLSFQLQDLGVQLAGGGNPLTAIVQQGSQVASTFGGIGSAAKTLGAAVGGTTAAIAGAAAVLATFGAAYYQGSEQSKAFKNAITQTGNAAGLTEGKFNALIARTADLANVSQSAARDMALAFVQSGQLSGQALEATVTAGLNIAKATGASIDEVQKQLLGVTNGVANFAATQNRSLNFLTSAQYRYIKSLEDQGQTGKAILVTMEALNGRYKDQEQNIGLIERSWNKAKKAVSDFWEAAKGIGRTDTIEQQIASLERGLESLDSRRSTNPSLTAQRKKAIQEQIDALKEQQQLQGRAAQGQAEDAQRAKVGIEYTDVLARAMSRQALAAKTLSDAKAKLAKSDLDASQQAQILAQLQKELDPGASQAISQSRIEGIKRSLADIVAAYEASESTLEASRQAGVLDDQTYYNEKISYVQRYAQARKLALDLENEELRRQRGNPDNMTADRQAIDDKIKDNLAEIGRLQQKAAADVRNYGIQAGAALGNASKGYAEARAAAEAYLQTLTRAQDRELSLFGAGSEARSRDAGRNQIADRYDEERRRIQAERESLRIQQGSLRPDQEKQFADLLQINEDYRSKALDGWDDYYTRLRDMQGDWVNGASEALANYADSANNTAAQSQRVFENAAKSMEDAIVTFAQTGKINFAQLASSIIADMLRVEAQRATSSIFSQIAGYAASYFGGQTVDTSGAGSTGGITGGATLPDSLRGGRAIGGPVSAGGVYRINEQNRPEVASFGGKDYLLTGNQSGTVRPASESGGGGVNVTVNIADGVTRADLQSYVPTIVKQVEAAVLQKQRRGATFGTT